MANNQEQFNAYHDLINVTATRRDTLRKNRQAIRTKIINYFKNNIYSTNNCFIFVSILSNEFRISNVGIKFKRSNRN